MLKSPNMGLLTVSEIYEFIKQLPAI